MDKLNYVALKNLDALKTRFTAKFFTQQKFNFLQA